MGRLERELETRDNQVKKAELSGKRGGGEVKKPSGEARKGTGEERQ